MKRLLTVTLFVLMLFGLLAFTSPAEAADCYLHYTGTYVCDGRQRQTVFSTPRYPQGSIFFNRTYAWLHDGAPLYNQPGGEEVVPGTEGILYYTIEESVDAGGLWYRVGRDLWAPAASMVVEDAPRFSGLVVNDQPERPFGWLLYNVRPADAPGAEPAEETERLSRYTFVEIYDVADGGDDYVWFDIGGGRWIQQTFLALIDVSPRPEDVAKHEFWVEVDLFEQTFAAYEGDRMVYAGLVSSGLDRFPTNEGIFQVYARNREWLMYGGDVGDDYYYLQDVPHTMFFDDDIALHGAYWHNDFGAKRSHGCVNMLPRDAEWIWYWSEQAPNDLWVHVHSSDADYFLQEYGTALANDLAVVSHTP
jgi:hypothetical protein